MDYTTGDYSEYPGSTVPALKVDFAQLELFAGHLGINVTTRGVGSFFSPTARLINIDTKIPNQRGFVSLGQLTDEYLHAWNQVKGRGRFLDARAAREHRRLGLDAERNGTRSLGVHGNTAFHRLEALNFVLSRDDIPSFIWRAPLDEVCKFGFAWEQHFV